MCVHNRAISSQQVFFRIDVEHSLQHRTNLQRVEFVMIMPDATLVTSFNMHAKDYSINAIVS